MVECILSMDGNRRNSERHDVDFSAIIRPAEDSTVTGRRVRARNASTKGAYFVTRYSPQTGELLKISASSVEIMCEVKRVEGLGDGLVGFAVTFLAPQSTNGAKAVEVPWKRAWSFELRGVSRLGFSERRDLKRVRDYVEQNPSKEVPLSAAAKIAVLESTYFSALFHEKVGVTFSEWLQYVRIRRALEMMNWGDYSISEIAYAVGFANLRTFERTFKKWTNVNPRTFKVLCRPDPPLKY